MWESELVLELRLYVTCATRNVALSSKDQKTRLSKPVLLNQESNRSLNFTSGRSKRVDHIQTGVKDEREVRAVAKRSSWNKRRCGNFRTLLGCH